MKKEKTKNEKKAEKLFLQHGFKIVSVKQYISKTVYYLEKDGMKDSYELYNEISDLKKNIEFYNKSFEQKKEIAELKKKLGIK